MSFSNWCIRLTAGFMLNVAMFSAQAVTNSSPVTIPITATFSAPTCELETPKEVFLGSMLQGTRNYNSFSIKITCNGTIESSLYASQKGGTPADNYGMTMTGPAGETGTAAILWLSTDDGNHIHLAGTDIDSDLFCRGNATRDCQLTPSVRVSSDTPRGKTEAIISFNMVYR